MDTSMKSSCTNGCSTEKKKGVTSEQLHAASLVAIVAIMTTLLTVRSEALFFADASEQTEVAVDVSSSESVIAAIGRHYRITQTAEPNIAHVTDAEQVRSSSPFFAAVENGDVIVYYPDEVFVYRPTADIIIKHGPVIGPNPNEQTEADVEPPVAEESGAGTTETENVEETEDMIGTETVSENADTGVGSGMDVLVEEIEE